MLCVLSSQIVLLLYGNGYNEVGPVISILSIWAMIGCIGNPVGNIVVSQGRTELSFYYSVVRLLIYIPIK